MKLSDYIARGSETGRQEMERLAAEFTDATEREAVGRHETASCPRVPVPIRLIFEDAITWSDLEAAARYVEPGQVAVMADGSEWLRVEERVDRLIGSLRKVRSQ